MKERASNLFGFHWPIDQAGYETECVPAQSGEPEHCLIKPCGGPKKEYDPINDYPALHRILAATDQNDDQSILDFISRFGLLDEDGLDSLETWKLLILSIKKLCTFIDSGKKHEAVDLFNKNIHPHFTGRIDISSKGRPELVLVPTNLHGAIWFLAAGEITRGVKFSMCQQCGTPFHHRRNKAFCSTKCRQVWHYHETKDNK